MVAVFRALGLGVLLIAVILHLVGFVTHYWVSAKLDLRGVAGIMSANDMGSGSAPANLRGLSVNLGLWEFCMKTDMGQGVGQGQSQGMSEAGQNSDGEYGQQDLMGQESDQWPQETGDVSDGSSSSLSMCQKPNSEDVPGELHV